MQTAMQGDARERAVETLTTVLGKLLAAAIILTPLVAMLFPELNHCSGNTRPTSRQAASGGAIAPSRIRR